MDTIRKQLLTAGLLATGLLARGVDAMAQSPGMTPGSLPGLPGGSIVSGTPPAISTGPSTIPYQVANSPIPTAPPQGSWVNQNIGNEVLANNCCGPVGGNGPLTSEIYVRTGPSLAFGNDFIAKQMNTGWTTTLGGRSLFFDVGGGAAWVADLHLSYTYNNAGGQETALFRNEVLKLRDVHRTGVGLAVGRDWFLNGPGFVGGNWDGNLRYGVDAGCRYGSGHVNLTPLAEPDGYRRHHDVYAQPFLGLHANIDVPMGGWNLLLGGRIEYNYTTVDFIHAPGDIQGLDILFSFGVRY